MKSTTAQLVYPSFTREQTTTVSRNWWKQFIAYSEKQQFDRLLWLAIGLAGHGTFFTILTLAVVILTGNVFSLFAIACFAMVSVVIVNLAAMPTKVTIPVLALSVLVDLGVIVAAFVLQ
jgi:hypothetical protein